MGYIFSAIIAVAAIYNIEIPMNSGIIIYAMIFTFMSGNLLGQSCK